MRISSSSIPRVPLPVTSSLSKQIRRFGGKRLAPRKMATSVHLVVFSLSRDSSNPVELDVRFPADYSQLLEQAKEATELALKDKKQLLDIEFPTSGLESVPGDGEGGIEMTESMQLIRGFCDRFIVPEKATRTRVFFPEANEVDFARQSVFGGSSLRLDYLTKPSLFEDFGFVSKVKMVDRVKPEDEIFLVAYPYFNVNEMLVVEELYKEAVVNTDRKLIIFNGELDRIRSGYYPPLFYPKLAALAKTFLPKLETVYYVHNFKGRNGGTLFRSYPGPWMVLRKIGGRYICLHQQEEMPSLKEVALNILPSA
ncbi:protein LOW PSII ACCUMULATION 3, chloroplastic-like [Phoenix dactylifera]|uniref:Protein LOW PSII ACCUMULATION 3, chloroplastic n=1 Tax=Phoenix dactylifera TaxID=42345 RepID=A0A8B9A039_PHODC|nr:protein LOW PSII ACCUMULATION 3, chloroplastic [Phoenix dactylifera]XP_038977178.1 protein LOW PSII ACCUMULATION 3, chloroplastic-like [Phoenix dactylifera]